jgi:small subunit ribosomal protein S1
MAEGNDDKGGLRQKEIDEAERAEFLAAMEQDFDAAPTDQGEMVKGTILSIGKDFAFVDLGGKSEGTIAVDELRNEDGSFPPIGSEIEACVLSQGADGPVLSKRLAKGIRSREYLGEAFRIKIPVEGRVESRNKGGFEIEVAGVRGFCPIGQIELRFCEDPDSHLGKRYNFLITKYETSGRRPDIVLSRRAILEAEAQKRAEELRKTLKVGDILPGTVRNIRDFGAFVDLDGIDGMLPVSELSYTRVNHPRDVLKEGEEIHVQVIGIERGGERITLSLKRLEADPWENAVSAFPVGFRTTGRISRLAPFGAFVELVPGVDGLIHISNLNAPERINHPDAIVKEGQEVLVEVLTVDTAQHRIGLKRIPAEGEFGSIPLVGQVVEGTVDKAMPFGVFVTIGRGRKGLVPNSELGTPKGSDTNKLFPPGAPVRTLVQEVTDNGKKIRLSIKAAVDAEERADFEGFIENKDSAGSGFGTLGDLLRKKKQS